MGARAEERRREPALLTATQRRLVTAPEQSIEPSPRRLVRIRDFALVLDCSERECYRIVSRLDRGVYRVGRGVRIDVDVALEALREMPEVRL